MGLKAVILAAGRGKRLRPLTDSIPKPLIHINNKPMIGYVISAIAKAGIRDFVIVTGYHGDLLKSGLMKETPKEVNIEFIHNPDYRLGNASSLFCAEKALQGEDSFILSMSDHLIDGKLVQKALESYNGTSLLCVDKEPQYLSNIEEATKVALDEEGYIIGIGKGLKKWDAVDTGIFHLDNSIFEIASDVPQPSNLSMCMRCMIEAGSLKAYDVTGIPWIDVDTIKDLAYAREVVGKWI